MNVWGAFPFCWWRVGSTAKPLSVKLRFLSPLWTKTWKKELAHLLSNYLSFVILISFKIKDLLLADRLIFIMEIIQLERLRAGQHELLYLLAPVVFKPDLLPFLIFSAPGAWAF